MSACMSALLNVTVCLSPAPRTVLEWPLQVPVGTTVEQAFALAAQMPQWPQDLNQPVWSVWTPGLWNHKCGWEQAVREGDRLELYRPLRVDPKVARRERFSSQGKKRAGLFAKRRPGAAAGY
ncbi:MAG: hypothetical protein RLZ63_129 [Pseudomonadota bacterium]|jgi:putative ubiquitin-RnfH superfamily antitoxin RatB of RatAB toxin-antitoxin module